MAICNACDREMLDGKSCGLERTPPWDAEQLPHILQPGWATQPWNCPDCNTPPGGRHHLGCDMKRCADCGWQAISCAHRKTATRHYQIG